MRAIVSSPSLESGMCKSDVQGGQGWANGRYWETLPWSTELRDTTLPLGSSGHVPVGIE